MSLLDGYDLNGVQAVQWGRHHKTVAVATFEATTGRNWSYQDLEKMDYREYENLIIEEIPSDPESEVGGYESSEEDGEPDNAQHFLNQSVDIQAPANDNFVYDSNEDFSDEDLIPLSEIQAELNRNNDEESPMEDEDLDSPEEDNVKVSDYNTDTKQGASEYSKDKQESAKKYLIW
ncbi:hypothetical protein RN001_003339 [Aquatica leii]|uniref:Uncharacterized protein n=1 Tax=Aquatica leii TaxID=1421715 RepID=A0AAN7SRJ9_9COLE|nr:hypothetical protein RN001_003339 [Aquatica leii]